MAACSLTLIQRLTELKKALADSSQNSHDAKIRDTILQLEEYLRGGGMEEDAGTRSLAKRVEKLRRARQNGLDVRQALEKLQEKVQEAVEGEAPFRSCVCISSNALGDAYDHRRVVLQGDDFIVKEYLIKVLPKFDAAGYPSQEKTRENYLKALRLYRAEEESLDWVAGDLLGDIDLNVLGKIEVGGRRIFAQVEADIFRLSSITVDRVCLHQLGVDCYPEKMQAKEVFTKLFQAMGSDAVLTSELTKLITQASLARPYFLLFKKLVKPELMFHLTTKDNHFEIATRTQTDQVGSTIVIKEVVHFTVMDLSAIEEKGQAGYIKFVRIMVLDREQLKKGSAEGSTTIDYNSKFYKTLEEAEEFDISMPAVVPYPTWCTIS